MINAKQGSDAGRDRVELAANPAELDTDRLHGRLQGRREYLEIGCGDGVLFEPQATWIYSLR